MFHVVRRLVAIALMSCTLSSFVHAANEPAPDVTKQGWYYHLGEVGQARVWGGFLGAHLALNVLTAYFIILQMPTVPKMTASLQDNEDGVALEERRCGNRCMANSQKYRDYAEHVTNFEIVGMLSTAASALGNGISLAILTAMAFNWPERVKYRENVKVFGLGAVGASMFTGIFALASTCMLAKLGFSYRDGISLPTLGKMQMALAAGIGYTMSTVPFLVGAFVKASMIFYDRMWPTVTAADSAV